MINEVLDQLTYLKLKSSYTYLKELHINDAISGAELKGVNKVLRKEVEAKEENNKLYNVKVAAFPYIATIDSYEFKFQPSIDEEKMKGLIESDFYMDGTNVIFIGNPGVGKTHLAISIGYAVAVKRNSVYFIKFNRLISKLNRQIMPEQSIKRWNNF